MVGIELRGQLKMVYFRLLPESANFHFPTKKSGVNFVLLRKQNIIRTHFSHLNFLRDSLTFCRQRRIVGVELAQKV